MSKFDEPKTIGLTPKNKEYLSEFIILEYFAEQTDAYKFAVAYALKNKIDPPKTISNTTTFAVGSLDSNRELYNLVISLKPDLDQSIYKYIQDLANWGIEKLYSIYKDNHKLDLLKLIE